MDKSRFDEAFDIAVDRQVMLDLRSCLPCDVKHECVAVEVGGMLYKVDEDDHPLFVYRYLCVDVNDGTPWLCLCDTGRQTRRLRLASSCSNFGRTPEEALLKWAVSVTDGIEDVWLDDWARGCEIKRRAASGQPFLHLIPSAWDWDESPYPSALGD